MQYFREKRRFDMPKVGRNDACPCGSGKKYKKCCLELDLQNNITHIAPYQNQSHPPTATPASQGDEDFVWSNYLYKVIAGHIVNHMEHRYEPEEIFAALTLWNSYSSEMEPIIKKAGVFPAAIEYCVAEIYDRPITQKELAAIYNVSVGTISKRVNEMIDYGVFDEYLESDPYPAPTVAPQMSMEKEMHKITEMLEAQDFDTIEEANDFLNNMLNNNPNLLEEPHKEISKKQQAQEILFDAQEEASAQKRIELAQKALTLYPHSPDAYNIIAESTPGTNLVEQMNLFKQGMLVGEKDLGQAFFEENKGHFWGIIETRPFMRSKSGYANCLWALGETGKAVKQFEKMIELNPNDNQGIRYLLITLYIELPNYNKALRLLETYEEDDAHARYSRVLIEFGKNGITDELGHLLKNAKKQNPHVLPYLVGKKRCPIAAPEYFSFGDSTEAKAYVYDNIDLWRQHPQLLKWLKASAKR
jgi:tetratricopeptide (TPR) repeat protein